ncbi:MAG: hypothetical protein WB783_09950 [Arenicellales bacterium]
MGILPTVGAVFYIGGWLWTVVIAFKETPMWGVGCLLVPVVWVYYLFNRWRKTWPCVVLSVLGPVIFFASGGTIPS